MKPFFLLFLWLAVFAGSLAHGVEGPDKGVFPFRTTICADVGRTVDASPVQSSSETSPPPHTSGVPIEEAHCVSVLITPDPSDFGDYPRVGDTPPPARHSALAGRILVPGERPPASRRS